MNDDFNEADQKPGSPPVQKPATQPCQQKEPVQDIETKPSFPKLEDVRLYTIIPSNDKTTE